MKGMEKILNKSNSFNYYKNGYESLTAKNQKLSVKNEKLVAKNEKLSDKNKKLKNQNEKLANKNNELSLKNEKILTNNKNLQKQNDELNKSLNDLEKKHTEEINSLINKFSDALHDLDHNLRNFQNDFRNMERFNRTKNDELHYAFVFNDSISNSEWLKSKDFSLINSAANYSFMYSLFRILNDARPMNILELGMGQTTKLTTQYANYFTDAKLTIIEGDQLWIDNFSKNLSIGENINIIQLDLETFTYDNTENIRFKGICDAVGDKKFDLIIIDGPQGFIVEDGESRDLDYPRTNVWELVPNNLEEDFIIIIDDFNRVGEQNTFSHLKELLDDEDISFFTHNSSGMKIQQSLFTEKYRFIEWI